jgi:prepilin-type N-terminal cleavage/methylation domain-containing protein
MRREEGFTIIELLVALAISLIVFSGAMAVMGTMFTQSSGVVSRTDAMQRGRVVMDTITRLLRAQVCGDQVTRVVPDVTTANSITFFADLSAGTNAPDKHTLYLDTTAHQIVDNVYAGSGSAANGYSFAATPAKHVLAEAAYASPDGTPFLSYSAYPLPLAKPFIPTAPLTPPIDLAEARRVASIQITFLTQPTHNNRVDQGTVLQDKVAVRAADPSQDNPNPYDCTSTP